MVKYFMVDFESFMEFYLTNSKNSLISILTAKKNLLFFFSLLFACLACPLCECIKDLFVWKDLQSGSQLGFEPFITFSRSFNGVLFISIELFWLVNHNMTFEKSKRIVSILIHRLTTTGTERIRCLAVGNRNFLSALVSVNKIVNLSAPHCRVWTDKRFIGEKSG